MMFPQNSITKKNDFRAEIEESPFWMRGSMEKMEYLCSIKHGWNYDCNEMTNNLFSWFCDSLTSWHKKERKI